ncbi:calcium and integrin-binding family member 4 isoform X1 [Amblyraja radiata]|uniref:calcium and integrin-binding family member 4 isoform X1 n=1 Tax=Amblyraja radiata TaxID=386614 RepID=UPI001403D549|nr:calcium and integrin-binding family member 4 isoform X1 [Amblyraja radiata]
MGLSYSSLQTLSRAELWEYQALTFLTTMEIQCIHEAFLKLTRGATEGEAQFLKSEQVSNIPALRVNPFRDKICKVFSTHENGLFSFEDFLDLFSAFSETASLSVKIDYAFQIFDLNDNNYIDQEDIRNIILRLTNGLMDEANILTLTLNILNEGDLNNDGMLSFSEFESVVCRLPDFQKAFTIRFRE